MAPCGSPATYSVIAAAPIAAGKPKLDKSLYPVLVPGGALFLTVLSLTLIGDAIQKRQARNLGVI